MNFKDWLKTQDGFVENMWGNIPCKTRKPSDGWKGKPGQGMPGQPTPMQPQRMKKK